jgi:hypothetical protein
MTHPALKMSSADSAIGGKTESVRHTMQTIRIIATSAALVMSAIFAIARVTGVV